MCQKKKKKGEDEQATSIGNSLYEIGEHKKVIPMSGGVIKDQLHILYACTQYVTETLVKCEENLCVLVHMNHSHHLCGE